jgi:hypothetical protein
LASLALLGRFGLIGIFGLLVFLAFWPFLLKSLACVIDELQIFNSLQ